MNKFRKHIDIQFETESTDFVTRCTTIDAKRTYMYMQNQQSFSASTLNSVQKRKDNLRIDARLHKSLRVHLNICIKCV